MKKYLLLLLLGGCAIHRPAAVAPVISTPVADTPVAKPAVIEKQVIKPPMALPAGVDSVVITPHRTLADKARKAVGLRPAAPAAFGHVGKKAVINIYYAPATVVGRHSVATIGDGAKTTIAEKHASQATDSATQQIATNAVAGRGNTTTQTATTKQATDWKAKLTGPLGWALAAVLVGGGLYLLYPIFIRRNA